MSQWFPRHEVLYEGAKLWQNVFTVYCVIISKATNCGKELRYFAFCSLPQDERKRAALLP